MKLLLLLVVFQFFILVGNGVDFCPIEGEPHTTLVHLYCEEPTHQHSKTAYQRTGSLVLVGDKIHALTAGHCLKSDYEVEVDFASSNGYYFNTIRKPAFVHYPYFEVEKKYLNSGFFCKVWHKFSEETGLVNGKNDFLDVAAVSLRHSRSQQCSALLTDEELQTVKANLANITFSQPVFFSRMGYVNFWGWVYPLPYKNRVAPILPHHFVVSGKNCQFVGYYLKTPPHTFAGNSGSPILVNSVEDPALKHLVGKTLAVASWHSSNGMDDRNSPELKKVAQVASSSFALTAVNKLLLSCYYEKFPSFFFWGYHTANQFYTLIFRRRIAMRNFYRFSAFAHGMMGVGFYGLSQKCSTINHEIATSSYNCVVTEETFMRLLENREKN